MQDELTTLATDLGELLLQKNYLIATAESCTGGFIAQAITAIAGSSAWFERGFVTYSNQAKIDMVGVSATTIEKFGAVSEQVVREMAEGALRCSSAQLAVAVTGIAGPAGGTPEKPVGTVWFGFASHGVFSTQTLLKQFSGNREQIRYQSIIFALTKLRYIVK